jgi:hypothetical protein
MEPDRSGTEQTSPRGNDWEVVQLTASTYASAPAPTRPQLSEEGEAKKGDDDSAAALLMSRHFSVPLPHNELESLLIGKDSKEQRKDLCTLDAVSNEADPDKYQGTCDHKLKDDLHRIPSFDKGKSLDMDSKALQGMGLLVGEEPIGLSAPSYNATDAAQKDLSCSTTESRNEKKTEESTLHKVNPGAGSTEAVSSGDHNKPDGSGLPRNAWWKQQLLSLYKNAKETTKFWPIVAAAAALVGMAYFGRRWQKGKLQIQPVKLQPSSGKQKISHAVGPLNRMKDILVVGNLQSSSIHGHA